QAPPAAKAPSADRLPSSVMPTPALVRLDRQGRVVVLHKVRVTHYVQKTTPDGLNVVVPETAYVSYQSSFGLDALRAFDTTGKEMDRNVLTRLLKKEVLGLIYPAGQELDSLQLRLFKEGTPVFVLPMPIGPAAEIRPPLAAPTPVPAPQGESLPTTPLGPYPGAGPGGTVAPPQSAPGSTVPAPSGGLTPTPAQTTGE